MAGPDFRRLHPKLTAVDLDTEPFIPELSPVVNPHGDSLMTRPWLDWARRLTLLVGVNTGGGSGGTGDVVGPAGAINTDIAVYDGTTGKLIKDSLKTIAQVISDAVNQAIAAILPGGKLPVTNLPLHKTTHQVGGVDAVDVTLLAGYPANNAVFLNGAGGFTTPIAGVPGPHATTHSAGGGDPVTVTNLAGYPGGTTNFLRSDGTFAAPTAVLPTAHHTTHEPGGTDALVNAVWTNQANTFTQAQMLNLASPRLILADSSQPANTRGFQAWNSSQLFLVDAVDDSGTTLTRPLTLNRNGDATVGRNLTATSSGGNVALKNAANVFTFDQTIDKINPVISLLDQQQPAGSRYIKIWNVAQGIYFQACDDAGGYQLNSLSISRAGDMTAAGRLFERGRATGIGEWIAEPYNAANFFCPGGGDTWSVLVGDYRRMRYTLIGKTMILSYSIVGSTMNAASSPQLCMLIPGGFSVVVGGSANQDYSVGHVFAPIDGMLQVFPRDATTLAFQRPDNAGWGVGSCTIRGQIVLELV